MSRVTTTPNPQALGPSRPIPPVLLVDRPECSGRRWPGRSQTAAHRRAVRRGYLPRWDGKVGQRLYPHPIIQIAHYESTLPKPDSRCSDPNKP